MNFILHRRHMNSATDIILRRIRAKQRGWVFTAKDFIDLAPRNNIGVIIHRLVQKGIIRKIGYGIYDFPVTHPKLGMLAPNPDAIASAIAARSGDTIQPSSAQLANQLGLDTQVPAKPAYLTSGKSTKIKIANYSLTLNHSKFLNKNALGINSVRVISALRHMGKDHITNGMIKKCKKILSRKDKSQLKNNLNQLPNWMVTYILEIIKIGNE
jgi:predicted transcriptional regulator of viral defense system